jgi:fatty-acid desaturase
MLAIAGSMSFEGEVIGWVAVHRRRDQGQDQPPLVPQTARH